MESSVSIKEFYSPKQIYIGTFVGGPLAGAYYLGENFKRYDKASLNTLCKILGVVFTVLVFMVSYQLPENFPNTIIPIFYSAVAGGIAWQWQASKEEVEAVESYGFQSNWRVTGVAVTSLVITLVALISIVMLMPVE
jgi:hypothetical protein